MRNKSSIAQAGVWPAGRPVNPGLQFFGLVTPSPVISY